MAFTNPGNSSGKRMGNSQRLRGTSFAPRGQGGALATSLPANTFRQEIEDIFEEERFFSYLGAVKGSLWAVLISIYLWLISGILFVVLLR